MNYKWGDINEFNPNLAGYSTYVIWGLQTNIIIPAINIARKLKMFLF